jgi:Ca-activated chloride channel family protein
MHPSQVIAVLATGLFCTSVIASEARPTLLILDGSNSMWGRIDDVPKIEIAREVISDLVVAVPADQPLGLMVYGHRREGDCDDIELLVPAAQGTGVEISARIDEVTPRGKTPIGAALIQAAESLDYRNRPASVVLVSDGIETCGVDLCLLADTLSADGFDFTTHIVGFDLDDSEKASLTCLADRTGGRFLAADDAEQLDSALQVTMVSPVEPTPDVALQDIKVRGSDVIFLAGRHDITIPPRGPDHNTDFVIRRHDHLDDPLIETFPPFIPIRGGDTIRILDLASGGIHFFPQSNQPGWGPAGGPGGVSAIEPLGGISGYRGPRGGLLGVFLGDSNPADAEPPPTLNFIDGDPGFDFTTLSPELGQVIYIGDGTTSVAGEFKEIIAPPGATRLFLGIADGWAFGGPPGYYDDNDGYYTVRIAVNGLPYSD